MLAIVTGLASEAILARQIFPQAAVFCGLADRPSLVARLEGATAASVSCLLSFGIAGALAPNLKSGSLLIANQVRDETGAVLEICHPAIGQQWRERLPEAMIAPLLGAERLIGQPGEKALAHQQSGAWAVDMESGWLARLARAHHYPLVVLRAIADEASCTLPGFAERCINAQGQVAGLGVLREIVLRPDRWLQTLTMGRDSRRAHGTLQTLVGRLGSGGTLMP